MKASELRIGNYVYEDYGGIYEVININSEGFDFVDLRKPTFNGIGRYDINSIKPIELTEEILLKCGFNTTFEKITEIQINENEVLYYDSLEKCMSLYIPIQYEDTSLVFNHCKYLHQLQNLYFALTNNELTINL